MLADNFRESVDKALHDSRLEPHWPEVEITKSTAMDDIKGTIVVLHELKALGVSLSIDDYGTDFSCYNI